MDLLSLYLRAAKKKGSQAWPASYILLFGNYVTMDFKPERFILLIKPLAGYL